MITHWPQFFTKKSLASKVEIPCVIINDLDRTVKAQFVCGNHYSGGEMVAEHLCSKGHRRMAVLTGAPWSSDSHLRLGGFQSYLEEVAGILLDPDLVLCANYHEREAYDNVERLLKTDPKITAIFCCNDEMAFGVIRKFKELGISCPGDISVIGYDDISHCASFTPRLTTVRDLVYDMAREGTRILVDYLEEKEPKQLLLGHTMFPVRLIERDSVRDMVTEEGE